MDVTRFSSDSDGEQWGEKKTLLRCYNTSCGIGLCLVENCIVWPVASTSTSVQSALSLTKVISEEAYKVGPQMLACPRFGKGLLSPKTFRSGLFYYYFSVM